MKKFLALIFAIIMVTCLFSCANNNSISETSESASNVSAVTSIEPASDTSVNPTSDTSTQSTIGYLTDEVDYFARDPYHVTFIYAVSVPIISKTAEKLEELGEKMNFTITNIDANFDLGKYVDAIEQEIGTGTDGFIFSPQTPVVEVQDDLCKEAGLPYVNLLTAYFNEDGINLCPTVQFDGIEAGSMLANWVVDNYANYFNDADLTSFGFMVMGFSADQSFIDRADGFINELKTIRPDLEDNIIYVDCIDSGFSIDSGYNKAAATISAYADINNWIIFGVSEEFNVGACRAVEAAGKTNDCVVISTGCDAVFPEWDEGHSPQWIATIPIYGTNLAIDCATGIVALMDGRATTETLWEDVKAPGDTAALFNIPLQVVTPDDYMDFIANSEAAMDILN